MSYKAPVEDVLHCLNDLAPLKAMADLPGFAEMDASLMASILEQSGRFAEEVLFPLNQIGDEQGTHMDSGKVVSPDGWKEAYQQFAEGGWGSLSFPETYGGMGMPWVLSSAVQEFWHGSNMAFSLCPLLTQGACEAILEHASDDLKNTYLEPMIGGQWTGTMNLTEPHAGSDLGAIKTRAVDDDGTYLITGQKIFITYGEHEMTDNIVHLVLARVEGAPEGVRGISLFLVPKFLPDDDGNFTIRNSLSAVSVEEKLGIHGSPTCVMAFESAKGFLVGEMNQGLSHMFTMMNNARHTVGIQANGVADCAYQLALKYALDRKQGKALSGESQDRVAIIEHADVQRMLLKQKSRIEAVRGLAILVGASMDIRKHHTDEALAALHGAFEDIMIPVVKGSATEWGVENVSLALQTFGGMGFIEETGVARYYRDQRITPIYEGTTGIQALDLLGRKLYRDNGAIARDVISYMRSIVEQCSKAQYETLAGFNVASWCEELTQGLAALERAVDILLQQKITDTAGLADNYLQLWWGVSCGWVLYQSAQVCGQRLMSGGDSANANYPEQSFDAEKMLTADYYFTYELPLFRYHLNVIESSNTRSLSAFAESIKQR